MLKQTQGELKSEAHAAAAAAAITTTTTTIKN